MIANSSSFRLLAGAGVFVSLIGAASAVIVNVPAVDDAFLIENSAANTGAHSHVAVGTASNGSSRRGLFRFDVASAVPLGATVDSVTLNFSVTRRATSPTDFTNELHAMTSDWAEGAGTGNNGRTGIAGEANWDESFIGATNWGTAGGDFSGTALSSVTIDSVNSFTFSSNSQFAEIVQAMADNPSNNFGFMMLASDESIGGTAVRVGSIESGRAASLVIDYTPVPESSSLTLLAMAAGLFMRRRR